MNCKKCEALGTVVLRRKDHYCENCFTTNINHKFRAIIGKNRAISPNDHILVCLSGGPSSTVLLDMIFNGITLSNHKKLRITPHFIHLIDNINDRDAEKTANTVINQCKQYDFNVYIIHLSEYVQEHTSLPVANSIPPNNKESEFEAMLNSMPVTIRNDYLMKVRSHLFVRIAEQLQCNYIFTAETTATLAINLLSNLTMGRGAQVQHDVLNIARHVLVHYMVTSPSHDGSASGTACSRCLLGCSMLAAVVNDVGVGRVLLTKDHVMVQNMLSIFNLKDSFCDTRNNKIKILRPMKDINKEELDYYIKIRNLNPAEQNHSKENSLQSVIGTFVTDLQDSFPATISTICKTADKIGTDNQDQANKKCVICKSFLRMDSAKLTALEATNFSRVVSLQSRGKDFKNIESQVNHSNEKSMFPFVNERLCYGCSRNYLEIDHSMLPKHIRDTIQS